MFITDFKFQTVINQILMLIISSDSDLNIMLHVCLDKRHYMDKIDKNNTIGTKHEL